MLISAVSKVIHLYTYVYILFHYGLSQDIEYSSLCYTVGPCCQVLCYYDLADFTSSGRIAHLRDSLIIVFCSFPKASFHLCMIYFTAHAPVFAVTSFSFMLAAVVANAPSENEVTWATRGLVFGGKWLGKSESSKLCIGLSVLQAVFMIALLELIFLLHLQSPFLLWCCCEH